MKLISSPPDFHPACRDTLFVFETDESEYGESVHILDGSLTVLGSKKITAWPDYEVNAADYARTLLSVEPMPSDSSGFFSTAGRTGEISVGFGTERFPALVSGGWEMPETGRFLTVGTEAGIGWSDYAELCTVVSPGTVTVSVTAVTDALEIPVGEYTYTSSVSEMVGFSVCMPEIKEAVETSGAAWKNVTHIRIDLLTGGSEDSFRFRIVSHEPSVQLFWQNPYGGIDSHRFESCAMSGYAVEKESIESAEGIRLLTITRKRTMTVCTRRSAPEAVERFACLLTSPRVWVVTGNGIQSAAIQENEINLYDPAEPVITFRLSYTE